MVIIVLIITVATIIFIKEPASNENNEKNIKQPDQNKKVEVVKGVSNYTYSNLQKQISQLDEQYTQVQVTTFGQSIQNRKLYLLKLGSGEKKLAVIGGVHGRESITSLLILKLIEEYSKEQEIASYNLTKLLDDVTFYFVPMLNPDGIEIAVNGVADGAKNKEFYLKANEGSTDFKRWKTNARGVDLNKQFPADWEGVASTEASHFESYKGSGPVTEAESKALFELTKKEDFDLVVCFHHSGNVIFWYYNQKGEQYQRDYELAKRISNINGYKVVPPEDSDQVAAGYKDWFIKEFKKPGFTIEIEEEKTEQPLPAYNIEKYLAENKKVLLELATYLANN